MEALAAALRAAALTGRAGRSDGRQALVLGRAMTATSPTVRGPRVRRLRAARVAGWRVVALDRDAGTVRVPAGVTLDLGATAKALAADRAAERAAAASPASRRARQPRRRHRHRGRRAARRLARAGRRQPPRRRAAAGSCASRRAAWRPRARRCGAGAAAGGTRTTSSTRAPGVPAREHWRTVSVAAATCVDANIASTAAIVLGARRPRVARGRRAAGAAGDRLRRGGDHRGLAGVIAAAGTPALWYLTRGTGLVTLVLLTASVVLGIVQVLRWSPPGTPRFVVVTLHRRGLAARRGVARRARADRGARHLRADPAARRRAAVRRRLPAALARARRARPRPAHRAHRHEPACAAAWVCGPGGACTGWPTPAGRSRSSTAWGTGSDTRTTLDAGLHARLRDGRAGRDRVAAGERLARPQRRAQRCTRDHRASRSPRSRVWLPRGPLADGWARRSGTPKTLLAASRPPRAAAAPPPSRFAKRFSAGLRGKLREGTSKGGLAVVDLRLRLTGGVGGVLRIRIAGRPALPAAA